MQEESVNWRFKNGRFWAKAQIFLLNHAPLFLEAGTDADAGCARRAGVQVVVTKLLG